MGCGQMELARTLFGKLPAERGRYDRGPPARLRSTARRVGRHRLLPEAAQHAVRARADLQEHVDQRLSRLSRLMLNRPWSADRRDRVAGLHIRPPSVESLLGTLSGGNQQKVGLAKWLTFPPKVLVLSEPTRGMDVGAKSDVVKIVRGLRDQGIGILVLSTEPETVLALADRILVIRRAKSPTNSRARRSARTVCCGRMTWSVMTTEETGTGRRRERSKC